MTDMRHTKWDMRKSGFTLIEFLIVFAILIAVGGTIFLAVSNLFSWNAFLGDALLGQRALEIVVKDMVACEIEIYGIKEIAKTLEERFLEVTQTKEEAIRV